MKTVCIFLLFLLVLVPCLSVRTALVSGEVSPTAPCVRWGDWTIGQSSGSDNAVFTTFITNSEKTACVKVDVKYCARQPSQYVYPIERFNFQITMNNGFTVRKAVKSSRVSDVSPFSPDTTFSVEAMLEGPADTTKVETCRGKNGRGNTPMAVKIQFIGYYGSDADNLKTVRLTKTWTQDEIDILRQEYVDMTPPDARAELPVPARDKFKDELSSNGVDDWNTGHYRYMIDDGLKAKKSGWLSQVNAYRKKNGLAVFSDKAFKVNSAYRNPYHQRFHVAAPAKASFHSRHCYGDALDIKTLDVDGDGTVEQVRKNEAKSDDAKLMARSAIDAGAKWTGSWEYYSTHTHADWTLRRGDGGSWPPFPGTVYSPPCEPPKGTDSTTTAVQVLSSLQPRVMHPPAGQYHRCGHPLTASGEHSRISSCSVTNSNGDTCTNGSDYYACTPHVHRFPAAPAPSDTYVTSPCGHRHKKAEASSHASVSFSCGSHSYYACQPPSSSEFSRHAYGTLPCGSHSGYRCKAGRSHTEAQFCPSKNGKACLIGTYYVCTRPSHKHVYPEVPAPSAVRQYACGHDTTHRRRRSYHAWVSSCRMEYGPYSCQTSGGYYYCTPHEHRFVATCSAGHSYNPESESAENKHRVRTCRLRECRQTWQRCVRSTPICNKPYRKRNGLRCWPE